jgi:hypothetical protein
MAASHWKVIGRVELQNHHWPSKTRHTINGEMCREFTRLEIGTYDEDAGVYLLHLGPDDRGTDTWQKTWTMLSIKPNLNLVLDGMSGTCKPTRRYSRLRPYFPVTACFGH